MFIRSLMYHTQNWFRGQPLFVLFQLQCSKQDMFYSSSEAKLQHIRYVKDLINVYINNFVLKETQRIVYLLLNLSAFKHDTVVCI